MQASSNLPFSRTWHASYCTQSSIGPVSCSINFNFSDPTGRNSVGGTSTATADFGSVTGATGGGGRNGTVSAYYQSSFGDYVTVLGGSGEGTLITHYHLVSSDEVMGAIPVSFAVPPLYRFLQGDNAVGHTPNLQHIPSDNPMASLTEDFDVTSPVIFGGLIPLAAGTRTEFTVSPDGGLGASLSTIASAQLTGLHGAGFQWHDFARGGSAAQLFVSTAGPIRAGTEHSVDGNRRDPLPILLASQIKASSEKSVGHRYAPMGAGSSARAAREPDVGERGFSFPVRSQLPFELVCPLR